MSPDQRETLATVQMLRFPSPTGLKETPASQSRRHRWSVYLSICLLMPALAAMIGIVAWAISIEVANENAANLIAATQQSKQHLQKQHQQQHQYKLSYLHLKRANQAAKDDQSSTTTTTAAAAAAAAAAAWAKQQPLASAVVVGEAAAAPAASPGDAADEEARWQARLAAKRATGVGAARRRVLPEAEGQTVAPVERLDKDHRRHHHDQGSATVLLTNMDQLSSADKTRDPEYSTGTKSEGSGEQQSDTSRQETGSPTEVVNGSESPESSGRGEPSPSEMMSGEAATAEIAPNAGNAWTGPKNTKKKASLQWLHHQQARKMSAGKLPAELSLDAHGKVESEQVNENNKALMKKLESASGGKFGTSKQVLIKQTEPTKVAPLQAEHAAEPVVVTTPPSPPTTTTGSIDSARSAEEEDAALHGKSDGLIDYSGGSVPASGATIEDDELANNGASASNNDADEELGYAAIASAISTSLASGSGSSSEKPHTGLPHPHLEGDTGRESRVSAGWSAEGPPAGRRRSAGENVAQVIDHIVERRKQLSNSMKGPQIVVVAPVGQELMRAQSLTLEAAEPKQNLPPVQVDRRISSSESESVVTGVSGSSKKRQLTNVRVKRNRPIGARLLGTGIEETTGPASRRLDGPSEMRFSERIQVIEDDDSSALIGGLIARHHPIQERGETDEVVDMVESSKVPVSAAIESGTVAESSGPPLSTGGEARFSRHAGPVEPRRMAAPQPEHAQGSNKLYLAEQVVREHVLRAQQRADKPVSQVAPNQQSSPDKRRPTSSLSATADSPEPFSMGESSESAIKSHSTVDTVAPQKQQQHQPSYQFSAPEESQHNSLVPPQLADQEFNVPAHMAESVIRQIERTPVEVVPFGGNEWGQFIMQQRHSPYAPQQQQAFLSASASEPMVFWRQQPIQRMQQHTIQPFTASEHHIGRMLQPEAAMMKAAQWRLAGNGQTTNEQRSISTRASGPQQALRHWLNSLRGHSRSTAVPVQQVAQARMPEPSQMDSMPIQASEAPLHMSPHATKTAQREQQQVGPPQQEVQEVQDSYEQMSYQMPPSYGGGYDMPPAKPHYGAGGDDNEKKSKGLTFHFGGGPIGGGSQLITSPMGIFKHLMIPLLPNPRVNLNGKVVFGVVLEKSTAFGEPKKKFKFWG